ncbi:MAG: RNA polymerase sigma-70 factor (ECF subfamily) [Candidatus Azotimanducaceae bacterium]|jgi:RNA polymerase sigma-70 factor (ECF subfamily)
MQSAENVLYNVRDQPTKRECVDLKQQALDVFLAEIERQAFRMAEIATRNPDDALDIVQDAMIKLVEKYSDKPHDEWRPLFFTILNSRITDYHRKSTLTGRLFRWMGVDDELDALDNIEVSAGPDELLAETVTLGKLLDGLEKLSVRQKQVFMLRTWQGFSVAETSKILGCSEGSVKTHLSRATESLMSAINEG